MSTNKIRILRLGIEFKNGKHNVIVKDEGWFEKGIEAFVNATNRRMGAKLLAIDEKGKVEGLDYDYGK